MSEREPIGVIGAGWVGLVTAACFAELGHEVHCRDIVPEKVESLSRGEIPIFEPGHADLSRVERVVEELGDSRDHAIVMKSTVPVGTGRSIRRRRGGLGYVSNPEILKEGSAVRDFLEPDRVV